MSTVTTALTVKQLLIQARERICKGWTKHACARDASGEEVEYDNPNAEYFCLIGSLLAQKSAEDFGYAWRAVAVSLPNDNNGNAWLNEISRINDWHLTTKSDVIAILDKAIENVDVYSNPDSWVKGGNNNHYRLKDAK